MGQKTLCLHFQIHHPVHLIKYHFFDIGKNSDYADSFENKSMIKKMAEQCYLPVNAMMMELIKKYDGQFRFSISISGLVVEMFRRHSPEVLESFKQLVSTGCVELCAQTFQHSLSSVLDKEEFVSQVKAHSDTMKELFGVKCETFCNTELIYSDEIGETLAEMGFRTMITEGAKHVLGWKSPNYLYTNSINPKLKLLLRNPHLSDDISERFTDRSWEEWPLTADKYSSWLNDVEEDVVTLVMNYDTLSEHPNKKSGIVDFFRHLPEQLFNRTDFRFRTPSEITKEHQPVAPLHVPYPISWLDEEKDITALMGNELQNEAIEELYKMKQDVAALNDDATTRDFNFLQDSTYFLYMSTKLFSEECKRCTKTPYETPYEAFINYMNVISDLSIRIEKLKNRT